MQSSNKNNDIIYKLGEPSQFAPSELATFLSLLKEQGKVARPTIYKIKRCKLLGICFANGTMVSIGAIKPKTSSDFNIEKSNLESLRVKFELELGYCFTRPGHTGNHYSSQIVERLMETFKGKNLMATTEIRQDNGMVRILEKNGFKLSGQPWKSNIHAGELGLYLKF